MTKEGRMKKAKSKAKYETCLRRVANRPCSCNKRRGHAGKHRCYGKPTGCIASIKGWE